MCCASGTIYDNKSSRCVVSTTVNNNANVDSTFKPADEIIQYDNNSEGVAPYDNNYEQFVSA